MTTTEPEPALVKPPIPDPGYWRPMQSMRGMVLQYAWTCHCGQTYYVLCRKHMEILDTILERCECMGSKTVRKKNAKTGQTWEEDILVKKKFRDDRCCRSCLGMKAVCRKCGKPAKECGCLKGIKRCEDCDGSGVQPV